MQKKILTLLKVLVGFCILIILLSRIQLSVLISTLSTVRISYIIPILFLVFVSIGIRTFRWQIILNKLGVKFSLSTLFNYNFVGTFFAGGTPGKLGDFGRAYILWKKKKVSPEKALFSILVDRGFDTLVLLAFGMITTIYFTKLLFLFPLVASIFFAITGILVLTILGHKYFLNKISLFFGKVIFFKKINFKSTGNYFGILKDMVFVNKLILITILNWVSVFIMAEILILAFNYSVNIVDISLLISAIVLITLIPITISGFGTRELAMVYFLSLVGINAATALSFSILWTFFGIIFPALIGMLLLSKVWR